MSGPAETSTQTTVVASPRSCGTCNGMRTVHVARSETLAGGGTVSSNTETACPDCAGGGR